MKVTMTEAICQEGMALLDGKAEIFVAHDAHPHHYLTPLSSGWRTRELLTGKLWNPARR